MPRGLMRPASLTTDDKLEEARSEADETADVTLRAILMEAVETWDGLAELEPKSVAASATLTRLAALEQSKKPGETQ